MGRMNGGWSRVVGICVRVVVVGSGISPVCGMVVSRARWSLHVVCIGVVSMCSVGEVCGFVGMRMSQWSRGVLVGV